MIRVCFECESFCRKQIMTVHTNTVAALINEKALMPGCLSRFDLRQEGSACSGATPQTVDLRHRDIICALAQLSSTIRRHDYREASVSGPASSGIGLVVPPLSRPSSVRSSKTLTCHFIRMMLSHDSSSQLNFAVTIKKSSRGNSPPPTTVGSQAEHSSVSQGGLPMVAKRRVLSRNRICGTKDT